MSYFEEVTQKARELAATAAEKAREAADSAKISAAIISEKRELDKNYRAIGQWYACENTGEVPEAIADVIAARPRARSAPYAARSATASSAPTAARPWANKPEQGAATGSCEPVSYFSAPVLTGDFPPKLR